MKREDKEEGWLPTATGKEKPFKAHGTVSTPFMGCGQGRPILVNLAGENVLSLQGSFAE